MCVVIHSRHLVVLQATYSKPAQSALAGAAIALQLCIAAGSCKHSVAAGAARFDGATGFQQHWMCWICLVRLTPHSGSMLMCRQWLELCKAAVYVISSLL